MTIEQYGHSQLPNGAWVPDAAVPAGEWRPYQYQYQQQWHPQVTKQSLSGGEHIVHGILTILTMGLWGIVWAIRAGRGRRTITYR